MSSGSPDLAVAFRTLGCKVNLVESEDAIAELLGSGVRLVPEADASVIVVNTCTVTAEADAKARKAVRRALKLATKPVVVVTGCLAALDAAGLSSMHERVVVESDKAKVAGRVAEVLGVATAASGTRVRSGEGFRSRAMLKVEDGCDAFCTYCIVPHARGLPRSVARTRVVAEAQELVEAGASEIVLTGINLGRYSDGDTDLPRLIEAVAATGIRRLRLSSIEPLDLTPELLSTLRETAAVCRHLHVPLQSGSDRVLDAMGRGYSVHEFAERIAQARAALPGLAVTTDVIAGFPTETAEEAEETLEFCREMDFAKMHVFRYSLRRGTPAAELPQLAPEVRAMRAEALRRLSSDLRGRHLISQIGAETEVLVERVLPGLAAEGTTRDYVRVRFTAANARPGDVRVVRLREVVEGGLCGDLAE